MKLSKERYDEIDNEVYHVLMDFDPDGFPFDVVSIAEWMGFSTCSFSSLDGEQRDELLANELTSTGFHICDKRNTIPLFLVFYNDDVEKGRWLYTIAHEIGHIVLKHGSNPTLEQEAETDYFAKQLMAPRCLAVVRRMNSPKEIHDCFCLSWEAANYLSSTVDNALCNGNIKIYENDKEFLQWCKEKGWLKD